MEKINFKSIITTEDDRVFRIIHYVTLLILIGFASLILERLIFKEYELITSYAVFTSILFIAFILIKLKQSTLGGYLVIADLLGFAFYISYLHNGLNNAMLFAIPGILLLAGLMFPESEFYIFTFFALVIIIVIGLLEVNGLLIKEKTAYTISDVFDRSLVVLLSALGVKIFSNEIRRSLKFAKERETEIRVKIDEVTASESRFRSLFENSLDPLLLVDETLQFIDCNKTTFEFLNVNSKEMVIGKNLLNFSDELQSGGVLSIVKIEDIKRIISQNETKVIEWVFSNKRFAELSFTLIPFGNKNYYLSHWRDITERKIYENELKEKQLFIERVTEQSPDIIYILNVIKNEFIFVNQNVGGLLGYTKNDLPADFNSSFRMLIHPDDISVFTNYHKNIEKMEGKYIFEYEYRLKAKDGTWKWFAGREKEFQREDGKTITVLGVLTDVSERKKSEEAIKLSEEKFSKAFKSSPVSINITRISDGKFIDVNNTFELLTGYKREEVIGVSGKDLGIWNDNNQGIFLFDVALGQKKVKDELVNFSDRYGNTHICRYTSERIELNGEGCLLAIVNDITEQYKTEQALIEAERKFSSVFKSSPNALLITSYEDKTVLEINDIALKIIGKERDEVIGKTLDELQFISEQDRKKTC